jgi:hypothetical protein
MYYYTFFTESLDSLQYKNYNCTHKAYIVISGYNEHDLST